MSFPAILAARKRAIVAAAVLLLALVAPGASAGTYQVRACDPTNTNRSWLPYADTGLIAADASCLADPARGMKIRNSLRGAGQVPVLAPVAATGGLQAVAPPGTVITGLHADATAYDEKGSSNIDGWRAGIRADGRSDVWCVFSHACSWIGPPTLRIDLPLSASSVQLVVVCGLTSGCARDQVRAAATLRNLTLDVRDDVSPALGIARGNLWGGGPWLQGVAALGIDGADNAGVRTLAIEAGGLGVVAARVLACDDYAMTPCPGAAALDGSIDTTRLPDGPNVVVARVVDAGGNVTEQRSTVNIDNLPPTVGAPEVRGGGGWRSENAFDLGIDARDPARGSGVAWVAWEVCRADGTGCVARSTPGAPANLGAVVPGAGEWKVRAWAGDTLREGPRSGWSAPLRFDPVVPGQARVSAGERWVNSAGTALVTVDLPSGEARGPSGVAGFAVSRGEAGPPAAVTSAGEPALVTLADLPEGVTRVRARAISGAGLASARVGEGLVRVDRTPPQVRLATDGAPLAPREGEWLRRGVRLFAQGIDQSALSGMDPAPEGEPVTRGAYLEYQVDDAAPVRVRGGAATVDLPDDGLHSVTVRAVDAAGNVSDPQRASFRVDRNAPTGEVDAPTADAPRRLRARIAEECIAAAALELRASGERDWKAYPALAEKREVSGLVPDDRLPAGVYFARFRVRDCAGNEGLVVLGGDKYPADLRLPLRATAVVDAGITARNARGARRATVRRGSSVLVRGRLGTLEGGSVAGRRVEFQERIGAGDWRLRAVRKSDSSGRVSARLRPGPSRRVRLVVAASERLIGGASRTLAIAVPARVTLRASRTSLRNGQTIRFSGRLLGGYVPRDGRELELQGFNPLKGRWQPVRTQGLRTARSGRFSTGYRFTSTVGLTVRYRFRVRVAPRPDHPFAQGFSRTVRVTVRG